MPSASRSSERVYRGLREQILTGALAPVARLVELQLAQRFAVSRTPVREAVQRLAWERLVTIIRRHGVRISDIDPHEQMLVLELRHGSSGSGAARKQQHGKCATLTHERADCGRSSPPVG